LLLTDTRTYVDRRVPVSANLRAVLDMRRTAPDGKKLKAEAFVFGLGHANITTKSRYLSTTPTMLEHAMKQFEKHQQAIDGSEQAGLGSHTESRESSLGEVLSAVLKEPRLTRRSGHMLLRSCRSLCFAS